MSPTRPYLERHHKQSSKGKHEPQTPEDGRMVDVPNSKNRPGEDLAQAPQDPPAKANQAPEADAVPADFWTWLPELQSTYRARFPNAFTPGQHEYIDNIDEFLAEQIANVRAKKFRASQIAPSGQFAKPGALARPQTEEQKPAPEFKILSYEAIVAMQPAVWLVGNVIPYRAKSVLFGPSDSFKSFIAIDLACSVSTGKSFHGNVVTKRKVIYIASEGANGVGRKRIPAWMAYHGIPPEERGNIFLLPAEVPLPNEATRRNLLAAIRAIVSPGDDFFLIIDVLRGSMTGSESDDEAAAAWTSAAENLIGEGATLLAVTHSPYSDESRARGHSHLWGSFDTRLQAEGDKDKRSTVLRVNRHKDFDGRGQWGFAPLSCLERPSLRCRGTGQAKFRRGAHPAQIRQAGASFRFQRKMPYRL
jgi:hypothetical protein